MTKKKFPTKAVVIGSILSILFLGVVAVGANLSFMDRIADKAGEILGLSLADQITIDQPEEEMVGGSGGVFQTDWYKIGNRVTYVKSGQFRDASTTIISFINPFGSASSTAAAAGLEQYALDFEGTDATSTVMNINLDVTGVATSSMVISCGGAADIWSAPTYEILNLTIPTSTDGVFVSGQATTTSGLGAIGTGTSDEIDFRVLLTNDFSYFTCVATGTPDTGHPENWIDGSAAVNGLVGSNNTFDGYWSVEVQKNLQ